MRQGILGAQVLLRFQLSVVLTESFETLPSASKAMHAVALGFVHYPSDGPSGLSQNCL
jgi:hypothetical protein